MRDDDDKVQLVTIPLKEYEELKEAVKERDKLKVELLEAHQRSLDDLRMYQAQATAMLDSCMNTGFPAGGEPPARPGFLRRLFPW